MPIIPRPAIISRYSQPGYNIGKYKKFTWASALLRFSIALVLVLLTYNPSGLSYFDWVQERINDPEQSLDPLIVLAGILLLIGWTMFLRATLRSLGPFGLLLAIGFFATLIWLIVYYGIVPADSVKAVTWLALVSLSGVLAAGMSWSHIRRRASGQLDVDDVEES